MNNKQLDMVLGYLNEGTEIDEISWLMESINEEINRFKFVNEDVEVLNEGKFLEKAKMILKKAIEAIDKFIKGVWAKIKTFVSNLLTKLKGLKFKEKIKAALSRKSTNESVLYEISGNDLLNWMKDTKLKYRFIEANYFEINNSFGDIYLEKIFKNDGSVELNIKQDNEEYIDYYSIYSKYDEIVKEITNSQKLINEKESELNSLKYSLEIDLKNMESAGEKEIESAEDFTNFLQSQVSKEITIKEISKISKKLNILSEATKYYSETLRDFYHAVNEMNKKAGFELLKPSNSEK